MVLSARTDLEPLSNSTKVSGLPAAIRRPTPQDARIHPLGKSTKPRGKQISPTSSDTSKTAPLSTKGIRQSGIVYRASCVSWQRPSPSESLTR